MMNKITDIQLAPAGGYKGFGPLGLDQGQEPLGVFQKFISSAIGVISIIAIIWFVFILVSSGISYMSAGSDQKATEAARKRITNGLVGLLITIFGIFLINFMGQLFNIPGILNVRYLFTQIILP